MFEARSRSSAIASQVSTMARAVLWWKSRRRLRTLRHSRASCRRSRLRLPDRGRTSLAALQTADPLSRRSQEARVGNDLPVGGCQEPGHTHIHADLAASCRPWHRVAAGNDDDVPVAVLTLDLQGLHRAADRRC